MNFTVYNPTTGRISHSGTCAAADFELQAREGMALIEGDFPDDRYYWNGTAMVEFPARPAPDHLWNWATHAWEPPPLEIMKTQRWELMKAARRAAAEALLVTPHGTFDADAEARQNIIQTAHLMQTAAQALQPGAVPTQDFTLADNSVVTLTAGQMVEVALLLADQISAAYARGRQVRAAIDAAITAEEVAAITWSSSP